MAYTDTLLKETRKTAAKRKNKEEYMNVKVRLILMRIKTFKWNGLPDTCNERMLEMSLLSNGFGMFRKINDAYVNLITNTDGSLNLYGDPTGGWGYGLNGYNEHGNFYIEGGENLYPMNTQAGAVDSVLVKDNSLGYPFINYVDAYAQRIADVQRSMDVIANMLKSPTIITVSEEDQKKIKKVLDDIDENCPWIVGINQAPYNSMKAVETGAKPEILAELKEYKDALEGEYDTLCGINNNPSTDKKERLIVPEVNANNDLTELTVISAIEERQKACETLKKFWGIDVSCDLRYNTREGDFEDDNDGNEPGENNPASDDTQQGEE